MKKLLSLTDRFADDVFRILRSATLEELAELLGSRDREAPASRPRENAPRAPRATRAPRAAGRPSARPAQRTLWEHAESLRSRNGEAEVEPPAVAEITDPERLLRAEIAETGGAPPRTPLLDLPPEAPPSSTEQPTSRAAVALRANEALVRASSAGVVIRRRKGA